MSERVRFGVIGVGRMGALYARIIQEHPVAELVALTGNTPEKTAEAASTFGVPGYPNGGFIEMLDKHPDLDAVIIATPEWEHLEPAVQSLDRGIAVLLEKPMACTLADAQRIAEAAETSSGPLMLCHSLRFDPRFARMKEAVAAGAVGTVQYLYGRRNADQQAATRILGRCHPAYWLSPHDIDIMRWVTGSEVTQVHAQALQDGSQSSDGLLISLRFSNGVVGRVENIWTTPRLNGRTRWGVFDIQGSAGAIELSAFEQGLQIYRADGSVESPDTHESPILHGKVFGVFPALVDHFIGVVEGNHEPLVTVHDGLATIAIAAAAERSLAEGKEIALEPGCFAQP